MRRQLFKFVLLSAALVACSEPLSPSRITTFEGRLRSDLSGTSGTPGQLFTFGQNANYALGLGDLKNRSTPTLVGTQTTWVAITEATQHGIGLQSDGSVWGWGRNDGGQIGVGDRVDKPTPVRVGVDTDWTAIAVGRAHTIAQKANGTLWSWGENQFGSLGLGDTVDRLTPTQVGTQTDWAKIAAGYVRSFVIKTNGTLWGFGGNTNGSLGNGVAGGGPYTTPIQIGTATNWSQVCTSNGGNHSAGIRSDGTLWTWGTGSSGQLGLGTTSDRYVPTPVGNLNTWVEVECGWNHTLALRSDGTLWAWGLNGNGQLGVGDTKNKLSPVQVGTATDWYRVAGGSYHTLAVKIDGALWAWGDNGSGQLGISGGGRTTPVRVGTDVGWKAVRATAVSSRGGGSSAAIR